VTSSKTRTASATPFSVGCSRSPTPTAKWPTSDSARPTSQPSQPSLTFSTYWQYRPAIEAITAQKGVPFIDGASAPLVEARDFADVNHLNREGSIRFMDHILADLPPVSGRSC
jgi:hypothetical protein